MNNNMFLKNIFHILKNLFFASFIIILLLVFWVNVLKSSFYLPISANYYQCANPYISAYISQDDIIMTTQEKNDYCVDLSIDFKNFKRIRSSQDQYNYLLLDFEKLIAVQSGSKHTFFSDPIKDRKYIIQQKNIGIFYLDFLENYNSKSKTVSKVQPKIRLDEPNLKAVLFKD